MESEGWMKCWGLSRCVCMYICMYKAVVPPFQPKEMKTENQTCFLCFAAAPSPLWSHVDGGGERMGRAAWLSLWNCVIAQLQANIDTGFLGRCAVPEVPWEQKILPWHFLQPLLGWWRWWVKGEKLTECQWWVLRKGFTHKYSDITLWDLHQRDGCLADVQRDGTPWVCQHCQPGTGLNAGHAGICSAFGILKKQNKTQGLAEKGKIVECCFPSALGCLGCVLWQGWACVR